MNQGVAPALAALARVLGASFLNLAASQLGSGLSPSALSWCAVSRVWRLTCSLASLLLSTDSAFLTLAGTGGAGFVVRPGVAWAAAAGPIVSERLASVGAMSFFNFNP